VIAWTPGKKHGEEKVLLIQRAHSFSLIELLTGRHTPYPSERLKSLAYHLTWREQQQIQHNTYDQIWASIWGVPSLNRRQNRKWYYRNQAYWPKMQQYLLNYLRGPERQWVDPEWGFPKGRRNPREHGIDCALRECHEETGVRIEVEPGQIPPVIIEEYRGDDHREYRHIYFLVKVPEAVEVFISPTRPGQGVEVSQVAWVTLDMALGLLQPYQEARRQVIQSVRQILSQSS
jgi:ADP-ribose pyrophosphatase YjhB (NUDIX family)